MLGRTPLLCLTALLPLGLAFGAPDPDCPLPPETEISELKSILQNDPIDLARQEAKNRTPAFLGVRGYGVTVPGVSDKYQQCIYKVAAVKSLPATSDVICSDEIKNLQSKANDFAAQYNSTLAQELDIACP